MREIAATIGKSVFGGLSLGSTFILANTEAWIPPIKFAGMVSGVILTIATAISVCFDIRKKWRNRNREKDDS